MRAEERTATLLLSNHMLLDPLQSMEDEQFRQKGRSESKRMGYGNDVDYFAVYSPDTQKVYLLPITHVKNTENCLRLIPTGNNQEKNVRYAAEYEL